MTRHLLPAGLSLLLLVAHFLRIANYPVVALLFFCLFLLGVRRPWVSYTLQTVLAIGVVIWLLTMGGIAAARMQTGEDWLRMALILGSVTALCAYAAWHFRHPTLRQWYGTDEEDIQDEADISRL